MMKYLIANVGTSDVKLGSSDKIKGCRETGKKLYDKYDECKKDILFPILTPIIEKKSSINHIYLFVTDQDYSANGNHLDDTVFFGDIIQKAYPNTSIIKITKKPNDYTTMYNYFQEELVRIKNRLEDNFLVYLSLTGGIPAANTALLLQGVKIFGSNSELVYVTKGGEVESINLNKIFQKEKIIENTILNIINYEYDSAIGLLESIGYDKNVLGLLQYLNYRKNFDFQSAYTEIQGLSLIGEDKLFLDKLKNDLDNLKKETLEFKILEIFYHLNINYKKGQYLEFASLLYRFYQAYLYHMFESVTHLKPPLSNEDFHKIDSLVAYIESENPDLKKYLDYTEISYTKPTRKTFYHILKFLAEKGKSHYRPHLEALTCIDQIIKMRNNSIYGHGFNGVSLEDITKTYHETKLRYPRKESSIKRVTIWDDLNFLVKDIKAKTQDFDSVNNFLIDKLKGEL